ncbi:MAG: hypothetical protein HRU28_07390 [Rhizobiales bacterium]|nr:hypothetical protein [Hyphomicrobiales bacterium]
MNNKFDIRRYKYYLTRWMIVIILIVWPFSIYYQFLESVKPHASNILFSLMGFDFYYNYINYLSTIIYSILILNPIIAFIVSFQNNRFVILDTTTVSAPKSFASTKIINIKYADIISIKRKWLFGRRLIIHHQNGKLTIIGSGFNSSNAYNDFCFNLDKAKLDLNISYKLRH